MLASEQPAFLQMSVKFMPGLFVRFGTKFDMAPQLGSKPFCENRDPLGPQIGQKHKDVTECIQDTHNVIPNKSNAPISRA